MKKVMWVKFGWSDYYRGGPVDGNYRFMKQGGGEAHEAFNFLPGPDGAYYCYVPPIGASNASPSSIDPDGWTVICLAKFAEQKGVHVVGWYENATLMGERYFRSEYDTKTGFRLDNEGEKFSYTIRAEAAFLVPLEHRVNPVSHMTIKRSFSYLTGPGVAKEEGKSTVLKNLKAELDRLRPLAIAQPDSITAPDELEDDTDPLGRFGTPEHRKKVEMAAEGATTVELKRLGYKVVRVAHLNRGYDLLATHKENGRKLYVEVKGTSGVDQRFYMTPNERDFTPTAGWRLAMVTDALGSPDVEFFTSTEMEQRFSLQPMVWIGRAVG